MRCTGCGGDCPVGGACMPEKEIFHALTDNDDKWLRTLIAECSEGDLSSFLKEYPDTRRKIDTIKAQAEVREIVREGLKKLLAQLD